MSLFLMIAYVISSVAVCCISWCCSCCDHQFCPVVFASFFAIFITGIVTAIPARTVDFTVVNVIFAAVVTAAADTSLLDW